MQPIKSFRILNSLLKKRQRRIIMVLIVLMMIAGVLDVFAVVSIVPFLGIAANPDIIDSSTVLGTFYDFTGGISRKSFLVILGMIVLVCLLVTNGINAFLTWAQLRVVAGVNASLGTRLLKHYLSQPYSFFLERNTAHLQSYVHISVGQLAQLALTPLLVIIQKSISVSLIVLTVIIVDPIVALVCSVIFCVFYGTIFWTVNKKLTHLGKVFAETSRQRYQIVSEAFGVVKLTCLLHLENKMTQRFGPAAQKGSRSSATQDMIAAIPRFALEAVVLTLMFGLVLYLISTTDEFTEVLPIIGFYALALFRIMPNVQAIYANITMMKSYWPLVNRIYHEFRSGTQITRPSTEEDMPSIFATPVEPFISLQNVVYQYPSGHEAVIRDVSLTIRRNTTVGICGQTGAGKSTLVDVIIGLIRPKEGLLLVNGICVDESNVEEWYRHIGYVPQENYLLDASIAENVAIGFAKNNIDLERVSRACRQANIASFIASLPEAYETRCGENGIRLSGGQKQRLGIARALYRDPEVIVFDEATSNLDSETEQAVMSALDNLSHSHTLLLIAHRLETLRFCDQVIEIGDGVITAQGTFEEIVAPRIGNLDTQKTF